MLTMTVISFLCTIPIAALSWHGVEKHVLRLATYLVKKWKARDAARLGKKTDSSDPGSSNH